MLGGTPIHRDLRAVREKQIALEARLAALQAERQRTAKMVHNGIEYGMMQAFAEGFAMLKAKKEVDFDVAQLTGLGATAP